ncbi:hypothetical protein [Rhodococcoides corynebacterioides]|uniref:Asp23/Gls24 family envelope stress response protein n=1 Tax=Rhodococcoides corynebacterioides TaxID=53972 RepID=A0ABS7P4T8_9NOCA|nr:hypothetical protein [Rhodococcus corynebacterioides]MBY6367439.1 Asp23/Gls24 family envelope stress response protein [Rhodococcus corynebacterioides]MBY6407131.1 Asp23/Gls24 family envelope stress response protein [Rhodococcus corynebacterioides]
MADPDDARPAPLAEPGERGSLTVLDRAIERIADASLSRTTGVVSGGGTFGRRPSRVKVTQEGRTVRAAADVTVTWPRSAVTVADDLRRDIARGMTDSGLRTESVDVRVGDFASTDREVAAAAGSTADLLPAPRPLAAPAATPWAFLWTLALLAGAAVLIRDAVVLWGWVPGTAWTGSALDYLNGLGPQSWMVPGGIAAAVVGALMVLAALKWRGRRYRPTDLADDVWIHRRDRAKLAAAPAESATSTAAGSADETTTDTKGAAS